MVDVVAHQLIRRGLIDQAANPGCPVREAPAGGGQLVGEDRPLGIRKYPYQ